MGDTLTEILHEMVMNSRRSRDIAARVGRNYHVLLNELNPNNENNKLGADIVLPLMNASDSDEPLHFLARQRGGVFIRLPRARVSTGEALRSALIATGKFGEMMRSFEHATDPDGPGGDHIEPGELNKFLNVAQQAQTMISMFIESAGSLARKRGRS